MLVHLKPELVLHISNVFVGFSHETEIQQNSVQNMQPSSRLSLFLLEFLSKNPKQHPQHLTTKLKDADLTKKNKINLSLQPETNVRNIYENDKDIIFSDLQPRSEAVLRSP